MEDCVFCKIIKNELPRSLEYEDDRVVVFKSIQPVAETHLLIVPKNHISNFMGLDSEMNDLVKAAQEIIKSKKLEEGYKIIVNGGKYQEVQHIHIHLLAGKLEQEDDILNNT